MIDTVLNFLKDHTFNILLIIIVSIIIRKVLITISNTAINKTLKPEHFNSEHEKKQQEDTLNGILHYVITAIIGLVVILTILSEIGIDITALVATAGIAGIALGFGAQSMVKDYLAGMFILAENHYRIGDVVRLNADTTVTGSVERITLRQTVLRDLDGEVHYVPNGSIGVASNMTMEHSNVNLNVGIDYNSDLELVEKVINEVGIKLANDPVWKDKIIEPPSFLRVNDFAESFIEVKITGKTRPLMQWSITGELRKRLKIAFDKNDIEIPFPQRVINEVSKSKSKKISK
jgi:moderate conductance mechanosensitive channel